MMTCPKSSRIMWCWNEKIALNVLLDISMVNFRVYALIRKYFHCNFERIFEPFINIFCFHASLHFFCRKDQEGFSRSGIFLLLLSSVTLLLVIFCYINAIICLFVYHLLSSDWPTTYCVTIVKLSQGTVGWTALKGSGVGRARREVQLPTSQNLSWGRFLC